MARIRSIKPEFWTSAQVLECSTNARLLFVGLWNFCDDLGRHPMVAKQVKAEVFPADSFTEAAITAMLTELWANGLVVPYDHDNKRYFYVSGWKHQRIDKPQPAKYPDPFDEHSTIITRTFPPDTIGEDKKGKDLREDSSSNPWPQNYREVFWLTYPLRVGKAAALKKLDRVNGSMPWATFIAAVNRYAKNADPAYTKHPATWLNAGCWDDELPPETHTNGKTSPILQALDDGIATLRESRTRDDQNTRNDGLLPEGGSKRSGAIRIGDGGNLELLPPIGD